MNKHTHTGLWWRSRCRGHLEASLVQTPTWAGDGNGLMLQSDWQDEDVQPQLEHNHQTEKNQPDQINQIKQFILIYSISYNQECLRALYRDPETPWRHVRFWPLLSALELQVTGSFSPWFSTINRPGGGSAPPGKPTGRCGVSPVRARGNHASIHRRVTMTTRPSPLPRHQRLFYVTWLKKIKIRIRLLKWQKLTFDFCHKWKTNGPKVKLSSRQTVCARIVHFICPDYIIWLFVTLMRKLRNFKHR